ncbi:MAG: L-serine ammonia-lyase, iron-sulfur-dependent, subunit alpha [Eubacteriales bacterium]|nr:L-serine ammonia-lyase, iron-sulfur-dependent, subunit alpha [Eubacteriales bacterium]
MRQDKTQLWLSVLEAELIPALGCTEPIAIAYAAALASELLGEKPEHLELQASNNIIKNVKSVIVPNSGGRRGLAVATCLGALAGNAAGKLEVLKELSEEDLPEVEAFIAAGKITVSQLQSPYPLHLIVIASAKGKQLKVEIRDQHTKVIKIERNGVALKAEDLPEHLSFVLKAEQEAGNSEACRAESCAAGKLETKLSNDELFAESNFFELLDFCENCEIELFRPLLERQYECNVAIAKQGLEAEWGQQLGRHRMPESKEMPRRLYLQRLAQGFTAAASDARMGGCTLPVVINSGSGNHGLTVSLPVWVYAKEEGIEEERFLRALLLSNLLTLYQKAFIGRLSAFCGITSAAASAVASIAWMLGAEEREIAEIVSNSLGGVSGMVCDGAKDSCAFKIVNALNCAFAAWDLAQDGFRFHSGDGLIKSDIDSTIRAIGEMAKEGMHETDEKIVEIMIRD